MFEHDSIWVQMKHPKELPLEMIIPARIRGLTAQTAGVTPLAICSSREALGKGSSVRQIQAKNFFGISCSDLSKWMLLMLFYY